MKKLIALLLAILLVLIMTGCGTNDDAPPPDNKYVAMAKEHGYWHGLGGISWGMSIDETLEVLNLTKEDTFPVPYKRDSSQISMEEFAVRTTIFGLPANMQLSYGKATDRSVTALAEKEWLIRIEIAFEEAQPIKTLTAHVQDELKALNLSYDEKLSVLKNKQSLSTLTDAEQGAKAIEIYKNALATLPEDAVFPENFFTDPIDRIAFLIQDKDYVVRTMSYTGYPAAILAKSY